MAAIQLLFACCVRGRTRRRQREGSDEQVIPDEESRLIPPPAESQLNVPNAVGQEIEERNARLGTIVRAKGGNMINTSAAMDQIAAEAVTEERLLLGLCPEKIIQRPVDVRLFVTDKVTLLMAMDMELEEDSTTVQNGTAFSSSEQTPRPLSIITPPPPHHLLGSATPIGTLPATYSSTSPAVAFLAPPPSPHSDRNSDSGQSALLRTPPHVPPPLPLTPKPPPVFEIKDEGELTIGWDD
ncbi:hypothetical protein LENED_010721 [Lentinula edodes]|uniref:Uncharacterized protein n=1 Tax=Lentinula edodes TaxID=5353 RepID=A0A1Q3EN62_LENED|nr:hypothetical protein LENED_010721 [Lentinula edodes]